MVVKSNNSNNSHDGEPWPYHPRKSDGKMVPCASNPCKLHGGNDVIALNSEEATAKQYEQESHNTGLTSKPVNINNDVNMDIPTGNRYKHGSDAAYADTDRIITDHDLTNRKLFKDNPKLIHAIKNAKHVMVDIDGVLGDFTGAVRDYIKSQGTDVSDVANEPLDYSYGKSDNGWNVIYDKNNPNHRSFSKDYVDMIAEGNAYIHEHIDKTAVEALNRLIDDGVQVTVVTNRGFKWLKNSSQKWKHLKALDDTRTWLASTGLKTDNLVFSSDKDIVDADVYFEDSPKNIDNLHNAHKNVIMIPHLYNRSTDADVIGSWSEITNARFS